MTRFPHKTALLLFLLLGLLTAQPAIAAETRKPNVIVFLVDDMGWMDCGVYGSKYYDTPNIDRFAKRAMRFTDAYSQPLCSPTRASLLTGKYSARHGITSATGHQPPQPAGHKFLPATAPANQPMLTPESKNYLEPSEFTLAEALRAAGYRTAHIGKWHLGLTQPHWPEQQGFETAFHCHPDPGPPGNYFSPYGVTATGTPGGRNRVGTITDGPQGEYIVDRLAIEAIRFIETNRNEPFFLNLWQYGVHGPWGHKEEYTKQFAGKKDPRGVQGNPIMASMLKSVDDSFGRILDTLDRLGLSENTIVIFNSDNGGNTHSNTGEDAKGKKKKADDPLTIDWRKWAGNQPPTINTPLRDGKGTLYEGGTRVPLMWSWPGKIRPGTTHGAVVGHIDLYPTLLDLLGLAMPKQQQVDGVSYAGVLKGTGNLDRKAFFNYFPHAGTGRAGGVWVRSGDFKLIRWFGIAPGSEGALELYNLKDDLGEFRNLAAAQPDRAKELNTLIDGFLKDTGATYPRPNPAATVKPATTAEARKAATPLGGWVPKSSKAEIRNGCLVVEADGRNPFLGLTGLKLEGHVTARISAKSSGGPGKIQWRTADQPEFPKEGQTVDFTFAAADKASETVVTLPVKGSLLHLRLYLPAQKSPVELDWVEFKPATGKPQRWDFDTP
ncbi:MAG TPA: sulfatase [Roseimicrobium sp.]|nr:sulfatase [Roseimicrobium sp.]